jgi:Phosphotransferase enzyme family
VLRRQRRDVASDIVGADWPTQFRPVLTKLVADGRQYFGSEPVAVEPVRQLERPFSTILHIRVARESGTEDAFVKILKPRANTPAQIDSMRQNVLKDFEMTARVHLGLAAFPGLTAVRPIACFPEELAIVTEQAPGPTLADVLARAAGWPSEQVLGELVGVLRHVGAWLRAVQAALPQDSDLSISRMRAYLDARLDDLERTGPFRLTPDGRRRVAEYREQLIHDALARAGNAGSAGDRLRAVWIHADFCPENVIARDGRITVLDFTMAKTGTVYHDISHLFLRIDSMKAKPWFRPRVVDRLQLELLDAFEPGLRPAHPLFELMLLQHVLCHLVAMQAPPHTPVGRIYAARLHARHRQWLALAAGLNKESWAR